MTEVISANDKIILRFDRGDDVITGITKYCTENNTKAGFFTGLGACGEVILAYYDLENKQYLDKTISEDLEIISLIGNIAMLDGKATIHCHGSFSDRDYKTVAGHVKSLTVSATCEIHLTVLDGKIERGFDESTGLNLMKTPGE